MEKLKSYVLIKEEEDWTDYTTRVNTEVLAVSDDECRLRSYMSHNFKNSNCSYFSVEYLIKEVDRI